MAPSRFPFSVDLLDTPAILIDDDVLNRNLSRMQQLANHHQISLRPHIKTHKSVQLAKRQTALGASGIAVAKLGEAEIMADGGITNIQIANQLIGRQKIERFAALSTRCDLSCAVDSSANILEINEIFATHGLTANLLLEIDSGLHRAGVDNATELLNLARIIDSSTHCRIAGLLTHAGHAYAATDQEQLRTIGSHEGTLLVNFASQLNRQGIATPVISVGSTPTARHVAAIAGVTELRVGNYCFNDAIQVALGVAAWEDCALTVLTTLTSTHADRFVIDAGSKVFSSDSGAHGSLLLSGFGQITSLQIPITRLSEEHGVVLSPHPLEFTTGTRLQVIPNHACPVMNLADKAWLVSEEEVIGEIAVDARGKTF